jgi:hypothetical protein
MKRPLASRRRSPVLPNSLITSSVLLISIARRLGFALGCGLLSSVLVDSAIKSSIDLATRSKASED